jgi:hypothetical protein
MPTNEGPNGNENGGNNSAAKERVYELLGAIQVLNYTANPTKVKPGGTTKLSWEVKLPQALPVVTLIVGGQKVQGLSGSVTVSVGPYTAGSGSTVAEFGLTAETPSVSRMIAAVTVAVDTSECKKLSIPRLILVGLIKQGLQEQLQGNSQISVDGNGISVLMGDTLPQPVSGSIFIEIPLKLNVPDWFDATMDIKIWLTVGIDNQNNQVPVTAPVVDVHVSWTWLQDLAGCTEFGQKIAQALMTIIAQDALAPAISQKLNTQVQGFANTAQANDTPRHRKYGLTSVDTWDDPITFTLCPIGEGPPELPVSPRPVESVG